MAAEVKKEIQLEIAHVLFTDIVGYSKLPIHQQRSVVECLNEIVRGTDEYQAAETARRLITIPTGDGITLVFYDSPETPAECALEISRALKKHPELQLRMGIHSGPVSGVIDATGKANVAGAGINIAQRVMDCGDAGHILLSKHVAEDLQEYPHWQPHLHELGECEVKHGVRLSLVNLFTAELGNSAVPEKLKAARVATAAQRKKAALRWLSLGVVSLLTVIAVIGFLLFRNRRPLATVELPEKSIAVLPFENRSEDKANAYFADGIQDEILTRLSKIADLKVISRTSTQQYQSKPRNLPEIAKQLGVTIILEGSVQKAADEVRVNVQLINAQTDSHLWADTYDRKLTNIFGVESEIAKRIAESLQAKLTGHEEQALAEKPTNNPEAYDAYLHAVAVDNAVTLDTTKRAADLYAEAVRLDPQFALAWARLAVARSQLYFNGIDLDKNSAAAVKEAADRAMSFQPELGEAWLAQGVYRYRVLRDFHGALESYKEALRRLPNSAFVLQQMAHLERRRGQADVAQKHYQAAAQVDPRNIGILLTLADTFQTVRRYDEAQAVLDRALEISPGNEAVLGEKALTFQAEGRLNEAAEILANAPANSQDEVLVARALQLYYERRFDDAIAQIQKTPAAAANDPRIMTLLGYCQKLAGRDNDARDTFTRVAAAIKPTPDSVVAVDARQLPVCLAQVYAGLGEKEKALEQARRAVADYDGDALGKPYAEMALATVQAQVGDIDSAIAVLPHLLEVLNGETCGDLQINPFWDPLRSDPRFQKLCKQKKP